MPTHDLKTWPEYFQAIKSGAKTFEIRKNDRDYKVGDVLVLREWQNQYPQYSYVGWDGFGSYTGETLRMVVTYILPGGQFGIAEDMCVMGIRPESPAASWREGILSLSVYPQRQDGTNDQLKDLEFVANRLGFYDAADALKSKNQQP